MSRSLQSLCFVHTCIERTTKKRIVAVGARFDFICEVSRMGMGIVGHHYLHFRNSNDEDTWSEGRH